MQTSQAEQVKFNGILGTGKLTGRKAGEGQSVQADKQKRGKGKNQNQANLTTLGNTGEGKHYN